ncbi:MAG TPA: glycosyltransferase [Bacteroidaceae bacterium]|nr:glycosyltransferase [Bacteroidaceae bacterium]
MFIPDITDIILLVLFCLVGLAILTYLWMILSRLPRTIKHEQGKSCDLNKDACPPVSVIICANDQQNDLIKHLPAVLEQQYSEFEVIVVLDADSEDSSADVLRQMEQKYDNLYHTFIPAGSLYLSRRKLAVTLGIKASRYDWLVFIEPDCVPASPLWLSRLSEGMYAGKDVVIGAVFCNVNDDTAQKWQKHLAKLWCRRNLQIMGWALAGKPFSAMGRNLAYRKSTFLQSGGFSNQLRLSRGEDSLYINKIANISNTSVVCHPDAFTYVTPCRSKREWSQELKDFRKVVSYLKGSPVFMIKAYRFSWAMFILLAVIVVAYSFVTYQIVPVLLAVILCLINGLFRYRIYKHLRTISIKS